MARVSRLILVSKEIGPDDIEIVRDRLLNSDDLSYFVVWDYDRDNVNEKWAKYEGCMVALRFHIREEEDK